MVSIHINKKRIAIGLLLALLWFLVFACVYDSTKVGLCISLVFLLLSCLKVQVSAPTAIWCLNGIWALACIVIAFLMPFREIFFYCSGADFWSTAFSEIDAKEGFLNILCILIVVGALFLLTARLKLSVVLGTGILIVLSVVNGFVYRFRGNEMIFADLLAVNTALNVVEQYSLQLFERSSMLLCIWSCLSVLGSALPSFPQYPKKRLKALPMVALCICVLFFGARNAELYMWGNEGTWFNGHYLNFYLSIRGYFVEKPDGYSYKNVAAYESEYKKPAEKKPAGELPNIVVIMNESFADLDVVGNGLQTNQQVMPFLDSLHENAIKGYALASVFGGKTANSEFEFLTGSSMAFMPDGSIPYQQYVKQETYSMAWLLRDYGYTSMATHPFNKNGWARPTAYPNMGFETSTFVDDYPCEKLVREFVSDQEMYEYVLNALEKQKEKPLFLFGITMQNHGGYTYTGENFVQTIQLDGNQQEYPAAEQYLSLINQSDQALKNFIEKLDEQPRDTVLLFFGDHMPNLEKEFYEALHGGPFKTLSEQQLQYKVPFLIWANYDIPEQTVACTSLNYLGRYLLEAADIELPPYYQFLKELEENIPSLNAMGYYSVSQQSFLPLDQARGQEAQWLKKYQEIQYNGLFDRKSRNESFFGRYMS